HETLLCGHFLAKLTPPLRSEGPKTLDWRFSSQSEPPPAATRPAGISAETPSVLPETHAPHRKTRG
ncbi:hypothetical protein A2U01_0054977, partial [Trifolium medium]|nr:hypothetical protein [Trifolium medium]